MVNLGYSAFAIGAVAGWSALFLRAPLTILSGFFNAGLWLAWALLVYGLAREMGAPLPWLLAGAGAGLAAHGLMIAVISIRRAMQ